MGVSQAGVAEVEKDEDWSVEKRRDEAHDHQKRILGRQEDDVMIFNCFNNHPMKSLIWDHQTLTRQD